MSSELSPSQANSASTALALPSSAERRVQRAKARLTQHLAVLDQRARLFARQTAWVAGMVLLGLAGAAAAASLFSSSRTRRSRGGMYYASTASAGGVGTALMLAALGLLSKRTRPERARTRSYST
jgi:hypothetical protein